MEPGGSLPHSQVPATCWHHLGSWNGVWSWIYCDLVYFNISVEREIRAWQPCDYCLSFGFDGCNWWPLELDML